MSYPLSTAEAVLRQFTLDRCEVNQLRFLLSTAEAVLRLRVLSVYLICGNYFYCLPPRRYWDTPTFMPCSPLRISIVYRWGGIETSSQYRLFEQEAFLLSTAEAVLRHKFRLDESLLFRAFLLSTAEAVLRQSLGQVYSARACFFFSIVYRWGGIETVPYL